MQGTFYLPNSPGLVNETMFDLSLDVPQPTLQTTAEVI